MEDEFLQWYEENEIRFHQGNLDEKEIAYSAWLEGQKAGQNETLVTRLEERKRHWHDVSRGILVGDIEEDEFEQQDATHMYGCYIDVVDDMRTIFKNKNG